jgi:hypothetical protein
MNFIDSGVPEVISARRITRMTNMRHSRTRIKSFIDVLTDSPPILASFYPIPNDVVLSFPEGA